jgi:hypothetical protein
MFDGFQKIDFALQRFWGGGGGCDVLTDGFQRDGTHSLEMLGFVNARESTGANALSDYITADAIRYVWNFAGHWVCLSRN